MMCGIRFLKGVLNGAFSKRLGGNEPMCESAWVQTDPSGDRSDQEASLGIGLSTTARPHGDGPV